MAEVKSIRTEVKQKDKPNIPKGATIINHECNISIEEIENGYLITKSGDIRYKLPKSDHTEYAYYTKKYYSEENPINLESVEKSLADAFEDDNYK